MNRWVSLLAGLGCFCMEAMGQAKVIPRIRVDGVIGPATTSYIGRALALAAAEQAPCLIIELDTPGGLLDATKEIVQKFYQSPVPTVVYVTPSGAHAASAGCFITLAADLAAMAPNTTIGAAHPVAAGGFAEQKTDDVMKQKMENFATSFMETIATKRHRNVEWAKSSVRQSEATTAEHALELKVIDCIADDLPDLLRKVDGRRVNGTVLNTAGAETRLIPPSIREKLFQVLARPEVMFILMLIAIYGLIGELSNPGSILPGVTGAIALILALYMASILPVNVAGLALVLLAIGLFIVDVFAPSHGALTAGGIIAFFLGSLMLFDRMGPAFRLSLALVVPGTLVTAAFFVWVFGAGLRAQMLPRKLGVETMVGKTVSALTDVNTEHGTVLLEGEYWQAMSDRPLLAGQSAEVIAVTGLRLTVRSKG